MDRLASLMDVRNGETWNVGRSEDLYAIRNWGKGYFGINADGQVTVHPKRKSDHGVVLESLVDELHRRGVDAPILLRFPEILKHRLDELARAFRRARSECGYQGDYRCVFPLKVNPQRHVVEEILRFGRRHGFGVEAGSKPELLAVLALVDDDSTPVVCNGFKDAEYIETVVFAHKLGKSIVPVVETFHELRLLIDRSAEHGIRPNIGVRVKLSSRGSGRWESSGGRGSKFGLTASELLEALDYLHEREMADRLTMLHFHIGSQVTNIRNIKEAVNEAARMYSEMYRAGAGLSTIDVGGGLGVDYDGSQTNFGSSVNYTLEEYAADVVFGIQSVCDQAKVPHPTIISESGRAVVAFHSVLIFNVLGTSEVANSDVPPRPEHDVPGPIANLYDTVGDLTAKNSLEMFHDALKYHDDALHLFKLGYLSLRDRSLSDQLFWRICLEIRKLTRRMDYVHEDLEVLEAMLADVYYCNFSLFQSMPDSWAIKQLFPIMPIHRLAEKPDRRAVIADVTCDSDGKVDRFIDLRDVKEVLELHSLNGEQYYLAAFLVGAYQEILGDLHNLFGDTHAVHVRIDDDGPPTVETIVEGDTVGDLLSYVQFKPEELLDRLRLEVAHAVGCERIGNDEANVMLRFFEAGVQGYTYLT